MQAQKSEASTSTKNIFDTLKIQKEMLGQNHK